MKTTTVVTFASQTTQISEPAQQQQHMTSLEIAELTGKQHKHVMEAIRKMEPAWQNVCGSNFRLTSRTIVQPNGGKREVPCYSLSKSECLFIATKFNDEARAKLVLRWEELERERLNLGTDSWTSQAAKPSDTDLHGKEISPDHSYQKNLALPSKKEILKQGDEIRRKQIVEENEPADGCLTVTQIADAYGKTAKEINKMLVKRGIQFWNGGRYKLTEDFADCGLAQDRDFHYYTLEGEKKQRFYLVWTLEGSKLIGEIIAEESKKGKIN